MIAALHCRVESFAATLSFSTILSRSNGDLIHEAKWIDQHRDQSQQNIPEGMIRTVEAA